MAHDQNNTETSGVLAIYDNPNTLLKAAAKVRDANYRDWDVFTPYPVHGMDDAMGLKRSKLPLVTFGAGITGTATAFLLQYWTSKIDWPLNVGGKPFNSWPAFVPVMFELTILFAGIATFVAMILVNRLPNIKKKAYDPSITRDKFAIVVEVPQSKHGILAEADFDGEMKAKGFRPFRLDEVTGLLKSSGATEVRPVYSEGWN